MRAFLMMLGIPYHVAMAYRAGHEWILQSGEGAPAFNYLAELIHLFRMPAFFVVAGYFASLLLARRAPGAWFRSRLQRLGVPLVAAMLTLVPLLNLACELSGLPAAQALASWRRNLATSGGYWIRHLWFIVILLYCSAGAALLVARRPALRSAMLPPRIDVRLAARFPLVLLGTALLLGLWQAGAIELFYAAGLATNLPQQILRLDELIGFAPWFAVGALIARAPRLRERVCAPSLAVALLGIVAVAAALATLEAVPPALGRFLGAVAALAVTQMLIAGTSRWFDQPHPLVERIVPASFLIYLVHLPIIVVLVDAAQRLALPLALKSAGVMVATLLLSWLAWCLVRRSPWLAFLFNGTPRPHPTAAGARATAAAGSR